MAEPAHKRPRTEEKGFKVLQGTGDKMPMVGLGTWKIASEQVASTVENAIKVGYRHLDCACDYGNEEAVGAGIKAAIEKKLITRKDLWVTSKLWNNYHAKEHVMPACKKTLADLGLESLDLYLIHFPISLKYVPVATRYPPEWQFDPAAPGDLQIDPITLRETWEAMEELVSAGLVKNIGICNYNSALLADLMKYAKIKPAVLQIEHHPFLQQPALIKFATKHGLTITGFSSFGAPSYTNLFDFSKEPENQLFTNSVIKAIAEEHKKTPAEVLLRWASQRGIIMIPKSSSEERLKTNLGCTGGFDLTPANFEAITALDRGFRFNDPGHFADYPIY